MIQLSAQPAALSQPVAGSVLVPADGDGTGFLDAFNANVAESVPAAASEVVVPAVEPALPDVPDQHDLAIAAWDGSALLWLGAAVFVAPSIPVSAPDQVSHRVPGDPFLTPPLSLDPSAAPFLLEPSAPAKVAVPKGAEMRVGLATVGSASATVNHQNQMAEGLLRSALPASGDHGRKLVAVAQATPDTPTVAAMILADISLVDPDGTVVYPQASPAGVDHKAPITAAVLQNFVHPLPERFGQFRPTARPMRALPVTGTSNPESKPTVPTTNGPLHTAPIGGSTSTTTAAPLSVASAPATLVDRPVPAVVPALSAGPAQSSVEISALMANGVVSPVGAAPPSAALNAQVIREGTTFDSGLTQAEAPTNLRITPAGPSAPNAGFDAASAPVKTNLADPWSAPFDTPPKTAAALSDGATASFALDPVGAAGASWPALAQTTASPTPSQALAIAPLRKPLVPALVELGRDAGSDSVELSLAPNELGRLRMSLAQDGGSVLVLLSAERPETIELIRRHADQLTQEFRQAGFSGATLSFGQWGGGAGAARPQLPADPPALAPPRLMADALPLNPDPRLRPSATGLDLRI